MSNRMSQVEAVVFFTKQVLGDRFQEGTPVRDYVTKEDRAEISHLVTAGMLEGTVDVSEAAKAKYGDRLRTGYVVGMITNHFNKSKALNGGVDYEAKNPGSRTNPELKALEALLAKHANDEEAATRIQAIIDSKRAEIEAKRSSKTTKVKSINPDLIPEELKDLLAVS